MSGGTDERFEITAFALALAAVASCGDNVHDEMQARAASEAMIPQPVDTVQAARLSEELVDARISEYKIQLDQDTIQAGHITFRVRNIGEVEHAFEVEGQDEEWEVEDIAPGAEKTLTVELTPGTYTVYCPVEDERGNHAELGMRVTLVVR